MDFNQLKNFMAVARTGNISRAAQELYVTQPSLSKSIAKLEEELKVPLFRHRKGRIELNEYGSVFLSSVDIAFSQLAAGTQTIQRMYEMDQHILSLGSNISAYLPAVLPGFCAAHPEIGIRQRDCSTQQMTACAAFSMASARGFCSSSVGFPVTKETRGMTSLFPVPMRMRGKSSNCS